MEDYLDVVCGSKRLLVRVLWSMACQILSDITLVRQPPVVQIVPPYLLGCLSSIGRHFLLGSLNQDPVKLFFNEFAICLAVNEDAS